MTQKNQKVNMIDATIVVSESELQYLYPEGTTFFEEQSDFSESLWKLGLDTSKRYEVQDGLTHRNRLNQVVLCRRYVGKERLDDLWLNSGYASAAAKDKASGSKMLEDIYRAKGLTEDMQQRMEDKDKYSVIDETVQG